MKRITSLFFISALMLQAGLPSVEKLTEQTQTAHQIESWWTQSVVRADVAIDFGGQRMVDGAFTFEAHGPRARYDRKDGVSIIFDGQTAWVTPAEAVAPMGRFHVLTWPWFIMAPFKMQGEGTYLSEPSVRAMSGVDYASLFQTFGQEMGDTPEDWYRFFINQESHLIEGMSYIVTYGKDTEKANQQPSIIKYSDYTDGAAPRIAQSYEFWYWNPETGLTVGDSPKGTGSVSEITYLELSEVDFTVPKDARELELPLAPINYSVYADLLDKYVADNGVHYAAWFANKSDLQALDQFLEAAAKIDLAPRSDMEKKAFYINLYNAAMLQAVFRNYPLDSVKDIGSTPFSIFKKKFIHHGDDVLSLDGIEKGILLKEEAFFDPRIHFAVNCASESCPPLLDEPFVARKLEAQLEAQTRRFANSSRAAQIKKGGRIAFSELFKWYDGDFDGAHPLVYLNQYREEALPIHSQIDWISYDWSLNVAR